MYREWPIEKECGFSIRIENVTGKKSLLCDKATRKETRRFTRSEPLLSVNLWENLAPTAKKLLYITVPTVLFQWQKNASNA